MSYTNITLITLGGVNAFLNVMVFTTLIIVWRVKARIERETSLIKEVGPLPQPVNFSRVLDPVPQPIEEKVEVKEEAKDLKLNPKTKKQIDLLTKELDRLKAL